MSDLDFTIECCKRMMQAQRELLEVTQKHIRLNAERECLREQINSLNAQIEVAKLLEALTKKQQTGPTSGEAQSAGDARKTEVR